MALAGVADVPEHLELKMSIRNAIFGSEVSVNVNASKIIPYFEAELAKSEDALADINKKLSTVG